MSVGLSMGPPEGGGAPRAPSPAPGAPSPSQGRPDDAPERAALLALAADERVVRAETAVREATQELRWKEALRRRWREARAECAVRSAVASASVEGAVIPASVLREAVSARSLREPLTGDPALDAAAGLWRAHVRLNGWMPDLRGDGRPAPAPARAALGSLHRDVVGPLAAAGTIALSEIAVPRAPGREPVEGGPSPAPDGAQLRARLEGIVRLIDLPGAPALVRAAIVHGELVSARPFSAGNAALGRVLVRHLVTRDGLEPTGTAVLDLYPARVPGAYAEAAAAYAGGTTDGVVSWIVWQAEALLLGVQEAESLLRAVQAGSVSGG